MMTRSIVTVPKDVLKKLDRIAKARHESRSALIREAIDTWLTMYKKQPLDDAFGLWKSKKLKDGVAIQRKLRDEWRK